MHVTIKHMVGDEEELARDCTKVSLVANAAAALLAESNKLGVPFSSQQINHMAKVAGGWHGAEGGCCLSDADILIESAKRRGDVAYLTLMYDPVRGLVMSMESKDREKLDKDIYLDRESYNKGDVLEIGELKKLYKASRVENNGKMVVLFLFATPAELRMLRMSPGVFCADTTFGTNRQKKGLFTLAPLDANNKAYNCGEASIPPEQGWVSTLMSMEWVVGGNEKM